MKQNIFEPQVDTLKQRIHFLESLLQFLPGNVYWKSTDGTYLGCNQGMANVLNLTSPDDIKGKTLFELTSTEVAERISQQEKVLFETGQPISIEEQSAPINGSKIYLTEKAAILDSHGHIIGLIGNTTDITRLKAVETELKHARATADSANQLKTEFIQNMQHDIRTPISGIWSLLEAMASCDNLQEFKEVAPYATKAAKELLDICNEVIDFESIEYGEKPMYSRKFSLIELAHSVINLNSAAALSNNTSLILDIDDDVPDIVKGDNYRLKKILINLLSNAVKFTEQGEVRLNVRCIEKINKSVTLRLSIKDTGVGIAANQIHTVFEKFTRLNPSNIGKFKGTGLGLHIVKKFATEMDAEFDIVSVEGQGTTFTLDVRLELPLVNQLADETRMHVETSRQMAVEAKPGQQKLSVPRKVAELKSSLLQSEHSGQKPLQVCLIEDDKLACLAIERVFDDVTKPCKLYIATTVKEAQTLLRKRAFDIVISDLGLPDGTGCDVVMSILKDKKHINHRTPFVALTAHSNDAKHEQAKQAGFVAVYHKPVLVQLMDKILADYAPNKVTPEQSEAVVDLPVSVEICGGSVETVFDLLTMLVDTFSKEKNVLTRSFKNGDFGRAYDLFHKLRGGLSYVRVPEVERSVKTLHAEVKRCQQSQGELMELYSELEGLFGAVDKVAAWLDTHMVAVE